MLTKKNIDGGLFVARIGLGLMFMLVHGWPKLTGGPELWAKIGSTMPGFGVPFLPEFWGLTASLAEFLGGLLLMMGWMFRPAVAFLAFTMLVASVTHISRGDGWGTSSHAIECLVMFLALWWTGPGAHSLDGDLPYQNTIKN